MDVDYDLSKELKRKYRHRIRQCYRNTYNLLMNNEIEFFVIGYIYNTIDNTIIRHAWGIKEDKIIDSSFGDNKKYIRGVEYNESFRLLKNELLANMNKVDSPAFINFDKESEINSFNNIRIQHMNKKLFLDKGSVSLLRDNYNKKITIP
ncbi:MAG: hypothetical protein PUJ51_23740 [Clostridiales bacterium]|jgi:hypothetical protein|uniref:hypothetical protein n=1 Tax=Peptostreptococcaceae TaxID=186804 RepID=UPI0023F6A19C|nr:MULTISPECIES: hypothetical protein [Peptostreptococcaceae]MCI6456492.1 hypothetical protein [Clostridium sp.]MCI7205921.1 hypothetical protein [Clostridium sp.]MDD7757464.1 hypothetical protein [Clostridiales bacterium]MDY4137286.1 hypothetical protein [Terrisporobacter sp.]